MQGVKAGRTPVAIPGYKRCTRCRTRWRQSGGTLCKSCRNEADAVPPPKPDPLAAPPGLLSDKVWPLPLQPLPSRAPAQVLRTVVIAGRAYDVTFDGAVR